MSEIVSVLTMPYGSKTIAVSDKIKPEEGSGSVTSLTKSHGVYVAGAPSFRRGTDTGVPLLEPEPYGTVSRK